MKEIGGYSELEHLEGREYHENALKLNCGRNAIVLAAKLRNVNRVFLPHYLCASVAEALKQHEIECCFYGVDALFQPIFPVDCGKDDMLLAVNYYGQLHTEELIRTYSDRTNLLIDNTQAFFEKAPEGADAVYSCRKFFGIPDGAYLYTPLSHAAPLFEPEQVAERCGHLLGRLEGPASTHLETHRSNDRLFSSQPIGGMSLFTQNILRAVNYDHVRRKRNENYNTLHEALSHRNKLKLTTPDGPFAYPFYIENGPAVRKQLAAQKIYVPTLWPNVLELPENLLERKYTENILPLPCDQRYSTTDMKRILEVLELCTNSEK